MAYDVAYCRLLLPGIGRLLARPDIGTDEAALADLAEMTAGLAAAAAALAPAGRRPVPVAELLALMERAQARRRAA